MIVSEDGKEVTHIEGEYVRTYNLKTPYDTKTGTMTHEIHEPNPEKAKKILMDKLMSWQN